jgi:Aldolase/RraA
VQALEEDGMGKVLVVDAGASMRCAVLGDNLAAMGAKNKWSVRFLLPYLALRVRRVALGSTARAWAPLLLRRGCLVGE